MNKIRLFGIGNEKDFNYIVVEKNKDFFKWLAKLLKESFDYRRDVDTYEIETKIGKWKIVKKDIKNYTDVHEVYRIGGVQGKERIDIFYGKERIFITIVMSQADRAKFMDVFKKMTKWKWKKYKGKTYEVKFSQAK